MISPIDIAQSARGKVGGWCQITTAPVCGSLLSAPTLITAIRCSSDGSMYYDLASA
jgi:hypothetical protein